MTEHRCKFCGKLLFKATAPTKKTIYIVCARCKKLNVM
jgi:phage FluMu protein Com